MTQLKKVAEKKYFLKKGLYFLCYSENTNLNKAIF